MAQKSTHLFSFNPFTFVIQIIDPLPPAPHPHIQILIPKAIQPTSNVDGRFCFELGSPIAEVLITAYHGVIPVSDQPTKRPERKFEQRCTSSVQDKYIFFFISIPCLRQAALYKDPDSFRFTSRIGYILKTNVMEYFFLVFFEEKDFGSTNLITQVPKYTLFKMFNSEIVYPTPCQALIPVQAKSSQILREYPLLLTTPLPPPFLPRGAI